MHIGPSESHFSKRRQIHLHIHCRCQNQIRQVHKIKYPTNSNALRFAFFVFIFTFFRCRPAFFAQSATSTSVIHNFFPLVTLVKCKFFIIMLTYDFRRLIYLPVLLDWCIVFSRSGVFRRLVYHHPSIRSLPSKLGSIGGSEQCTVLWSTSLNCIAQPCGPPNPSKHPLLRYITWYCGDLTKILFAPFLH